MAPTFRPLVEPLAGMSRAAVPRPGLHIGDLELVAVLGRGSFGKVFLARQVSLDRQVALKVTVNSGNCGGSSGSCRAPAR
jgi:hypothetical protein